MDIRRQLILTVAWLAASTAVATAQTPVPYRVSSALSGGVKRALQRAGAEVAYVRLVRADGLSDYLVAAAWLPARETSTDYGPRVVVLRAYPTDSAEVVYVSDGLMDSTVPDLLAIAGPERTLILADMADEGGSWGFAAYEISPAGTRELALLDVGVPGRAEIGESDGSALPYTSGVWENGHWVVRIDTTVVWAPNQESPTRRLMPTRERAVSFELRDGGWVLRP